MNHPIEDIPPAVAKLAELRERAGRDGRTEVTLGGTIEGPSDVERYTEAGVDRVFVTPWRRTSDAIESLRAFAADFLPG